MPAVLGSHGIEQVLPIKLDEKEQEKLNASGKALKAIIDEYEKKE